MRTSTGQHQRDEDHPEEHHAKRKAEEHDRIGGQEGDDDLAMAMASATTSVLNKHALEADSGHAVQTPPLIGVRVVLDKMTAGQQRNRRTQDFRRGHRDAPTKVIIDRKGHDEDADDQHQVTEEIGNGRFSNHVGSRIMDAPLDKAELEGRKTDNDEHQDDRLRG